MKLSESLNAAINEQICHELKNQNIYLQIASWFEDLKLKNLANHFKSQASEEFKHASKFIQYLNERTGGKFNMGEVDSPNIKISSIGEVGQIYIDVEEGTTESIESLMDLALEEKSYIDMGFIQDMLNSQVIEEDEATTFEANLRMCKDIVLFDATFGG
jgi:ferritin